MSSIFLNNITYRINQQNLFKEQTLSFSGEKIGLVGKNGVGKSTLLRLIMGELLPNSGTLQTQGTIAYFPQQMTLPTNSTISDVLGIEEKLAALARISKGSVSEEDYALLDDDWQIKARATAQLKVFSLSHIPLNQTVSTLSGGERTRLYLAKCFLENPDYLLLDEPTNNLDTSSRRLLYSAIRVWKKGLLVVSHDRELLNSMEKILEISSLGLEVYGGNYDAYLEQKELKRTAAIRELEDAKKKFSNTQKATQRRYE